MTTTVPRPAMMPKPHRDRGIEGRMAQWYAGTTAKSMADFRELAQRIARELPQGGSVLEIAPGPGYLCIELAKLGPFAIRGVDLSASMVKIAREKAVQAGVQVDFEQGNSSNLPYPRETFDFLVCRAAFKNFAQPVKALEEMYRVLKPGGAGLVVGPVNRLFTKLAFRWMLLKTAYAREHFEQMLAQTPFARVRIDENEIGLEVRMEKSPAPETAGRD